MSSNTLEFFVKMKDMMSGGLAKLAQNSQNTFTKMKGHIANAASSTKFLSTSIDGLREKLRQVNQVRFGTVMKSEFNQATRAAKNLESQISRMEGRRSGRGLLSRAASYIGPFAIAAGLMSFSGSSIKTAMNFEATRKSFQVLTGSRTTGNDLSEQLRTLKQDTIMGPTVYVNAQKMLGFGVAANKVIPDLKMLGDVSMGDADKLKRLTLAFSEVTAAGKLNGRRMLQFVNAGFNPLQEMSRTTGKSMEELTKRMSKGNISAKMLEDAFKSATGKGGRFGDMMNVIGETSFGKMKKLEGQWANFKINSGEALMPVANMLMGWGTNLISIFHKTNAVSESLKIERAEIGGLVGAITSLNQGNSTRQSLLHELIIKYPDLFGKIDIEKTKNSELLDILNKVNEAYDVKISKAANTELHDQFGKQIFNFQTDADHFAAILHLVKANKIEDAIRLKDKWLPGLWDNDFNSSNIGRTTGLLQRGFEDNTKWANASRNKDNAITADDNQNLVSQAQAIMRNGTFKGIKKNEFGALILATMHKVQSGTATADDMAKLQSFMPVTAAGIKPTKADGSEGGDDKSVAAGITGGGPRVVNIHFRDMVGKIDIHSSGVDAGLADMEHKVEEHFLRILNSGASVQ